MPPEPTTPPHLQAAHWLATPLAALPERVNTALAQGMTAPQIWAVCCTLLGGPDTPLVPLDSFTLHAPLEVLARWQLLPLLPRADRPLALLQMLCTAVQAAQTRQAVAREQPQLATPWPSPAHAAPANASQHTPLPQLCEELQAALNAGDLPRSAQLAHAATLSPEPTDTWCHHLARVVRNRMGASAHVPICLQLLARLHRHAPADAALARPLWVALAVELARQPERRVAWPDTVAAPAPGTPPLLALLARQTAVPQPQAEGIWPMVAQTLNDGAHHEWLPGADKAGAQALPIACRAAAWSMLQEPLTEARYGWTHALTLPQAWWALSAQPLATAEDVRAAARLGTLHLAAMRRVIGQVKLALQPPPAALPFDACARLACIRADAHAVKYVLACIDAAQASPPDAPLYQAAATRLCQHWAASVPEARILEMLAER